jgi:hypothetical protein|uniref:Uncharacterized protein n=1 Tax=viral metagenome TaxID=1070528 RepID=A0A6C0AU14_9ZZZZ
MSISKYINIPLFLLSLAFGLFAVYITLPDTRKIYVYPTPENVGVLQYKDKTDTCFSFKQTEVTCPSSDSEITKIPVQA